MSPGSSGSIVYQLRSTGRRSGIRTFDIRMLAAFLLFIAVGMFSSVWLGHFTPRQMGTFWPLYFMMVYTIVGLWVGLAFVAIGLSVTALTLIGYFFIGGVRPVDGIRQWRRADRGRPLDAPGLRDGRARRYHPPAAAAEDHGGAERAPRRPRASSSPG